MVSEAAEFKEVMDGIGVADLPLSKGQWTRSNRKSMSRIDRFFVSSNFLLELTNVSQKTLPRLTYDHYPVCVEVEGIQWGPVLFQLDNKWLKKDKFRDLVENSWKNCEV